MRIVFLLTPLPFTHFQPLLTNAKVENAWVLFG